MAFFGALFGPFVLYSLHLHLYHFIESLSHGRISVYACRKVFYVSFFLVPSFKSVLSWWTF